MTDLIRTIDPVDPYPGAGGLTRPVLELEGIGKEYAGPPPTRALGGIDLRVEAGEYVGIVGPSGSGKSTLLNLLGGLDRPTEGTLRIDGHDIAELGDRRLSALRGRRIGFVFQSFNLVEGLDAVDNVGLGLLYAGVGGRNRRQRSLEALDRVGLAHRSGHRLGLLSGGERQRVAIARALVTEPALLLADEPTGNLDTANGEAILGLFDDLHRDGATIVLITHDPEVASSLPRCVTLRDGHLVDDTRPPALAAGDNGNRDHAPAGTTEGDTTDAVGGTELERSRLRLADLPGVVAVGPKTRRLRTVLTTLGIAIGIAAVMAVMGISESSRADLLAELDALGTNRLQVGPGQSFVGGDVTLPETSASQIRRLGAVEQAAATTPVGEPVRRSDLIPETNTGGIVSHAVEGDFLDTVGATVASGRWHDEASEQLPTVVLGSVAAERLGIPASAGSDGRAVRIGGEWFTVIGILDPVPLYQTLDAGVFVGYPVAGELFGTTASPSSMYVTTEPELVDPVRDILPATTNPEAPGEVEVISPTDALAAREAVDETLTRLLLGLGAVALVVGGIGVANVMVIGVLERRTEIGVRRALGATRSHVRRQFLGEAILLGGLGGVLGVGLGTAVTAGYAMVSDLTLAIPPQAIVLGLGAATAIGALAGLSPAARAARLAPVDAIRPS